MNPREVRAAWESVADAYAKMRDPGGPDAALLDELLAPLPSDATVVDVGCGDGARTLANLSSVEAVGVDVARRPLELARETVPGAHLLQGEMTALPVADGVADAVTAYHAVFHVSSDDHPAVYREFARVVRPGGYALLTVGSGRTESVRNDWLGTGERMYWSTPGPERTRTQLRAAGFAIEWTRTVDDPLGSATRFVLARLA
jgi:ubiquinone/menaquinone biosynthesis C-methylase UbiE